MSAFPAMSPDQLPDLSLVTSMSGLAYMQAVARGEIAGAPIAGTLNFTIDLVEDGRVVVSGTPEFGGLNLMGTVHGGWYGTLLDSCMACAVMTKVPQGRVQTTMEFKVNIIRPLPLGVAVLAEGRVQHVGRSTGIATGELRGEQDGRLYATGSTTCMIMAPPPA